MVRVYQLQPRDLIEGELPEGPLFHSDSSHSSFQRLRQRGVLVEPIPETGIQEGTILVSSVEVSPVYELVYVVDRLLGPGGCPWDQAQTHETLKKYLLEESYEVFDAIDSGDMETLKEELGDLLLQPLMHTQMEKLKGNWDIDAVAQGITDKLVRRHPHVFGDVSVADADEVLKNWDAIKQREKNPAEKRSILAGVPKGMASLLRAHEVSKRAVRVGFEWPEIEAVFDKLHEEEQELHEAISSGIQDKIESELGDLLFTVVNIARWAKVEPEDALRKMLNRFTARFMHMEAHAQKELRELSAQEWDDLWVSAKASVG